MTQPRLACMTVSLTWCAFSIERRICSWGDHPPMNSVGCYKCKRVSKIPADFDHRQNAMGASLLLHI